MTRGGQRPAKPDPPNPTTRPKPSPARPRDQLQTNTDIIIIIIFFFRVSGGPQILWFWSGIHPTYPTIH